MLLLLARGQRFQGGSLPKKTLYWYKSTNTPLPKPASRLVAQGFSLPVQRHVGDIPQALEQASYKLRLQIPNFSLLLLALQGTGLLSSFAMSHLKLAEGGQRPKISLFGCEAATRGRTAVRSSAPSALPAVEATACLQHPSV